MITIRDLLESIIGTADYYDFRCVLVLADALEDVGRPVQAAWHRYRGEAMRQTDGGCYCCLFGPVRVGRWRIAVVDPNFANGQCLLRATTPGEGLAFALWVGSADLNWLQMAKGVPSTDAYFPLALDARELPPDLAAAAVAAIDRQRKAHYWPPRHERPRRARKP